MPRTQFAVLPRTEPSKYSAQNAGVPAATDSGVKTPIPSYGIKSERSSPYETARFTSVSPHNQFN